MLCNYWHLGETIKYGEESVVWNFNNNLDQAASTVNDRLKQYDEKLDTTGIVFNDVHVPAHDLADLRKRPLHKLVSCQTSTWNLKPTLEFMYVIFDL